MPEDAETDEYELLPHREIEDLKQELSKLKEFEIAPSKKLHVSLLELNHKLDKLIAIFEDAQHEMRLEEGGLSFADKMRPVVDKMNRILEQNAEIASGILAVADMLKDKGISAEPMRMHEPMPQMQHSMPPLPPMPQGPSAPGVPPGIPLPPMPRRRTFGL